MTDISRPVLIGGFVLTFISGIVNAVGFLSFAHQGLTHLTGITTHISISANEGSFVSVARLSTLVFSFVVGAIVSGAIIQKSNLKLGRNYGFALLLESTLLYLAIHFLKNSSLIGECLVASACGLQNAMATTYAGSILRTTHLTGVFTDLGLWIGHFLRKLPVENFALKIYLTLICGFLIGGFVGAILFRHLEYNALLIPTVLLGLVGFAYIYFELSNRNESNVE